MRALALSLAVSLAAGGVWAEKAAKPAGELQKMKLDAKKSVLKWTGKKVTGQHTGRVRLKSGEVMFVGDTLAGGNFEVDMKSIKVEDITDPVNNAKLTGHLNSADFFETDKHPVAAFKITKVVPRKAGPSGSTHDITGDLTIKGITQPVTFPAKVSKRKVRALATGTMTVDRTLYNIKYGSGKFFQGLGDKLIYDLFTLDIELFTTK